MVLRIGTHPTHGRHWSGCGKALKVAQACCVSRFAMIEATNHEAARACVVPWTMAFVKQRAVRSRFDFAICNVKKGSYLMIQKHFKSVFLSIECHGLTNQHVVDSGSLQHTTQWWCNDGRAYYGIPARDTLRNSTHPIWSRV